MRVVTEEINVVDKNHYFGEVYGEYKMIRFSAYVPFH